MKKGIILLSSLLLVLTACSSGEPAPSSSQAPTSANTSSMTSTSIPSSQTSEIPPKISRGYDGTVGGVHFTLPDLGEKVEIHTEKQKQYLAAKAYATVNRYADGKSEASYQEPVKLTWVASGTTISKYKVALSTNEDLSNSLYFESNIPEVSVDNLMIGTTYYWNVTVNDEISSGTAIFVTDNIAPRNLRVPGVKNVRDMGGIKTTDGKLVKQNRIIRLGALTQNETGAALIKQEGIDILNNQFHMKTEIDLRGETEKESGQLTGSILGPQVNYRLHGMSYTGSDMLGVNKESIRNVLDIFADENNYPICFHCSEGTDRAGLIAFLLNIVLGVSEIDTYKDYLFSAFRSCGGKIPELNNIVSTYVRTIKSFAGSNLREQTYSCLTTYVGVKKATLDKIVELNLM